MVEQRARDIHALIKEGAVSKPVLELREQEKLEYADAGTELEVSGVAMGTDNDNRTYYQIQARHGDQPVSFRLYSNGVRDSFLESIGAATSGGPVGGLRLVADRSGKGKPRVDLAPS